MATNDLRGRNRNPGPGWGYLFLVRADRVLPARIFSALLGLGTWVAVAAMPQERRHSRRYLAAILGRRPTSVEIWRHFHAFAKALMLKLRVGEGRAHRCAVAAGCGPVEELMASPQPALLGTFHIGNSDLVGFMLGRFRKKVSIIRVRVGNSRDTRELARQGGDGVAFIWVNERENLIFALKEAVQSGGTIAMECDRVGYSARLEAFDFLGRRRLFPFSIYHLALIFRRPVVICVAVPDGPDASTVTCSPVFEPGGSSREDNLSRARVHFQDFLMVIESLLRQDPYLWFNFIPLNPIDPAAADAPA